MPSLESVKLALGRAELSDEALCFISCNFEHFASKIKEFQITLRLPKLNNSAINTFADCALAHMTNLENLDLEFYSEKDHIVEPAVLVNLFDKMKNCVKKLKDFSFSTFDLNLPLEAIQALTTNVFPNLSSLTFLFLGLERNNLTDSEFTLFFSGLKGVLKEVRYFGLVIKEPVLSDQSFDYLWTNILPQLKSLWGFICYVDGNGKMNDETFIKFNKSFQKVASQITSFTLAFENIGISNKGVKEFALKTLAELKRLKTLDINFGGAAGVKDEGMADLFDGLRGIIGRLRSLKLDLQRTGITDVGIEAIKKRKDLDVWKKCSLDISGNEISQENQSFVNKYFNKE